MSIQVELEDKVVEFPSADDFNVVESGVLVLDGPTVVAFFPNGHFRYVRQGDQP